ncbi:MAG: amidohydrolase family protein [Longimicrobiales bacterium]
MTTTMKTLLGALAGATILAATPLPTPTAVDGTWAFTNVTVIPMDRERVLDDHTVVVVDGVITAVGPAASTEVPADATVIEGRGRWLMPGLAEMHAHVPPSPQRPPAEVLDDILFLYVANGITSIRGMLGSPYQIDLRAEIRAEEHLAPDFWAAAPSINGNSAPTPEAAERMIRDAVATGYDLMKIHPGVSRETWDHMVAVADEVGLTFGGHVPAAVGIEHALATGISTVDHVDGYLEGASGGSGDPALIIQNLDEDRMRALARQTAAAGAYVVPTMYLWENLFSKPDADDVLAQPEMRYVSQAQRDAWRNQNAGGPDLPDDVVEAFLDARKRMLRYLAEAGAPLLMGTDSPQLFNVPGFALHRELAVVAEAGISNYTVLESGTRNVARYVSEVLGQTADFGVVAEGLRADLVLLDADPLDDLAHLTERAGVMVRGRWVPRSEIDAGLAALAAKHGA